MYWLDCGVKRSRVTVTAGIDLNTLWTPYLTNQWREFYSFLVTDVCEFREVLISFWGQMSKVKVKVYHISPWWYVSLTMTTVPCWVKHWMQWINSKAVELWHWNMNELDRLQYACGTHCNIGLKRAATWRVTLKREVSSWVLSFSWAYCTQTVCPPPKLTHNRYILGMSTTTTSPQN